MNPLRIRAQSKSCHCVNNSWRFISDIAFVRSFFEASGEKLHSHRATFGNKLVQLVPTWSKNLHLFHPEKQTFICLKQQGKINDFLLHILTI